MSWESLGGVGNGQMPHDEEWILFCYDLAKKFLLHACGNPPEGCELGVFWQDHDFGSYPSLGLYCEYETRDSKRYWSACEAALEKFESAIDWSAIKPDGNDDEDEDDEVEDDSVKVETDIYDIVCQADGLLITAGAGMGVESGLPDFRGEHGFWKAYPALQRSGVDFYKIASPDAFLTNPKQAWGFYGHRLNLYRQTVPNAGFDILKELAQQMPNGAFIFTSNVDGQFQKAGFSESQIVECHGSIHHLQCVNGCCNEVVSAKDFYPDTDDTTCELLSPLPQCPYCESVMRPNILMFNDGMWLSRRMEEQQARFDSWMINKVTRLLVIEIGAGTSIPTVRNFSEFHGGYLIRINPDESDLPSSIKGLSIPMGGLAGLQLLASNLAN